MILKHCMVAETFWERFKGLMLREVLEADSGLLIEKCNSIHNCFMKFPIDAVFLDENNTVVETRSSLRPWFSLVLPVKNAVKVLEVNAEFVHEKNIGKNDRIFFDPA